MLQLILGRSGSGKTQTVLSSLRQKVQAGEAGNCLLLVPEQFSFETERALLESLGPQVASSVKVYSFTRLAEMVARELGGRAGRLMDEASRTLLMSQAVQAVADRLSVFRRHLGDPAQVQLLLGMVQECKQCAITPGQLEQAAAALPEGTLRQKTTELSLVCGAYEALAAQAYVDPLDALSVLAVQLPDSRALEGTFVFVDGFKGFTEQELAVLKGLLIKAETVTVTLCTDTLEAEAGGCSLFATATRTANQLIRLSQEQFVKVASVVYLTENHRHRAESLRALEAGAFRPDPAPHDGPAEEVTVTECGDLYSECNYIARSIRRYLREGGRARDVAVVSRNLGDYDGVLDVSLEQAGIPYYMDMRENIVTDTLTTVVLSALRVVTGGWDTGELLRLLKTGLLGFSSHSIALLENYVFLWRVNGAGWRDEWKDNPEGLSVKADEQTQRLLSYLNLLRRRLVRPLERLQGALSGKPTGEEFAKAVYRYLSAAKIDRLLRLQVRRLDACGEPALAERMARLWDTVIGMLDTFASVVGRTRQSAAQCCELLQLVAGATDLGEIPQGLDAVQVGQADRMRFSAPKLVCVLGANEGVFPAAPTAQGLLSDTERRTLIAGGLPLTDASDWQTAEERFYAYAALCAPSERLIVTYPIGNAAGETLLPSILVETVKRLLPRYVRGEEEQPDGTDVEGEADAFRRLSEHWRDDSPLTVTLREVFTEKPEAEGRIRAIDRAAKREPLHFTSKEAAQRFFGDDMRLSPSRVEQYHLCRFAYFCRYGLKAKVRKPADLDAAEFGTLAHYVMERELPVYTAQGFNTVRREQVFSDAARAVDEYVETYMGGKAGKSDRFLFLLERLGRTCGSLLWQVVRELRQSRFVPVDYELKIGLPDENGSYDNTVPAVVLTLPDGARIQVQGVVDRVDVYETGGVSYVRVVDYKTGSKEFRLRDVVEGLNLQMLIYILSIWQNGGPRYGSVTPAGLLYLPAKLPVVKVEETVDGDALEKKRLAAMRMNGLLLDNPEVIRAMEVDAAGVFIPAKLNSRGEMDSRSSVATLAQFGQLKKRVEQLLSRMAEALREGDIEAVPVGGEADGCRYCPYRAVCGHEEGDKIREIVSKDAKQVLDELSNEE